MASFVFNLFKGDPTSPSSPTAGDSESKSKNISSNGVAHYGGTFDLNTGSWSLLPNDGNNPVMAEESSTGKNRSQFLKVASKHELPENYKKSRRVEGDTFCEIPITIANLNADYRQELESTKSDEKNNAKKQNDHDDEADDANHHHRNSASPSTSKSSTTATATNPKRNFIRLVVISDTHQYHNHLTLPHGDVLIHCGDILMTDRFNPAFLSNRYLSQFFGWFNDEQKHPHPVKMFIGGNHCAQLEALFKASEEKKDGEFEKLVRPAIFLTGDEVLEVFGIRFFGCSWSTTTGSGNDAFQGPEVFDKLVRMAREIQQKSSRGGGEKNGDIFENSSSKSVSSASTQLKLRQLDNNSSRPRTKAEGAVDILISHCNLHRNTDVLRAINPALHFNGHYHGYHGLRRGTGRLVQENNHNAPTFDGRRRFHTSRAKANWSPDASSSSQQQQQQQQSCPFVTHEIPNVNAAIVGSLEGAHPRLNPPIVIDIIPLFNK